MQSFQIGGMDFHILIYLGEKKNFGSEGIQLCAPKLVAFERIETTLYNETNLGSVDLFVW